MPIVHSISGLRATQNDGLSPELINKYISAFSKILPNGPVVVGRDGRQSGKWIEDIVLNTFTNSGREVRLLNVVPTPTVQLMVEHSDAIGGIVITASHNPSEWNGLKFIGGNGVFLDEQWNRKLWNEVDLISSYDALSKTNENKIYIDKAIEQHIDKILSLQIFTKTDILNTLRKKRFKIVVDAVNASGSRSIPMLLEKFGCEVIKLYCDESGIFPHTPEPLPENLKDLADAVKVYNADLGIAVDPDADRLVLIDDTGSSIGEENTIVLCTESVLEMKNLLTDFIDYNVVVNHSTTRRVEEIAEKYDAKVFRSPVGEINVVKKMKEVNAIIGGEGSGGVILPECHYGRDSLVGSALILTLIARRNISLSELVKELPHYDMLKTKKQFSGNIDSIIGNLIKEFPDGIPLKEDGIKINFPTKWVQLRASNTEPIVRLIAEAKSYLEAKELLNRAMKYLQ